MTERSVQNFQRGGVLFASNAGAHNAIYRGKYLGSAVTDEQYAQISAGTFEDLYIGDYRRIDGVNYRNAGFNYYYNTGDTNCKTPHAVIVPDSCLSYQAMNSTATTSGGYAGSEMYTTNMAEAKSIINSAFSGHVLTHRIYLTHAITNGYPSGGSWYDSTVDLMSEIMVYGTRIYSSGVNSLGATVPDMRTAEKSQLPLFRHNHSLIVAVESDGTRGNYWLRDIVSASRFAFVHLYGYANYTNAFDGLGVRPAFCIS